MIDSKNLLGCRFPTFVGISADKNQPKDAEVPEHKLQSGIPEDDAWLQWFMSIDRPFFLTLSIIWVE